MPGLACLDEYRGTYTRAGTVSKMVASVKLGGISDPGESPLPRHGAGFVIVRQPLKSLELSKMIRIANFGVRNNFMNETDAVARRPLEASAWPRRAPAPAARRGRHGSPFPADCLRAR